MLPPLCTVPSQPLAFPARPPHQAASPRLCSLRHQRFSQPPAGAAPPAAGVARDVRRIAREELDERGGLLGWAAPGCAGPGGPPGPGSSPAAAPSDTGESDRACGAGPPPRAQSPRAAVRRFPLSPSSAPCGDRAPRPARARSRASAFRTGSRPCGLPAVESPPSANSSPLLQPPSLAPWWPCSHSPRRAGSDAKRSVTRNSSPNTRHDLSLQARSRWGLEKDSVHIKGSTNAVCSHA